MRNAGLSVGTIMISLSSALALPAFGLQAINYNQASLIAFLIESPVIMWKKMSHADCKSPPHLVFLNIVAS